MKMEQLSVGRPLFDKGDRVRLLDDIEVWDFEKTEPITYKKGLEGRIVKVGEMFLDEVNYCVYVVSLDSGKRCSFYQPELELVIKASLENV